MAAVTSRSLRSLIWSTFLLPRLAWVLKSCSALFSPKHMFRM